MSMASPALKIIKPRLRTGALALTDNTSRVRVMYKDLLDYLHDPATGYETSTMLYQDGLEVPVYLPDSV
jgi:hypothetical protein